MTYGLAKELEDRGFPKHLRFNRLLQKCWNPPTLSELIEACGNDITLGPAGNDVGPLFFAQKTGGDSVNGLYQVGETYKIATARLWLALNKK